MINYIKILSAMTLLIASVCSCSKDDDIKGVVWSSEHVYSFTANPDIDNKIETLTVESGQQSLTLSIKSLLVSGFPMPDKLYLTVDEWDENKGEWTSNPFANATDIKGDFFHVYTEVNDGKPQIKVDLSANETSSDRRIKIYASSDAVDHIIPYGNIQIIQSAGDMGSKSFTIKARYKGKTYMTIAEINADGDIIFHDEKYQALMDQIDANPTVQMVILEDSTVYYYDDEDILKFT